MECKQLDELLQLKNDGYLYLAKNASGECYAYKYKPCKKVTKKNWYIRLSIMDNFNNEPIRRVNEEFPSIAWRDTQVVEIQELIDSKTKGITELYRVICYDFTNDKLCIVNSQYFVKHDDVMDFVNEAEKIHDRCDIIKLIGGNNGRNNQNCEQ